MKHQECNFALVEIGEAEKTGYWFLQGGDWECKDSTLAHTYWYPDNITQEEINQEIYVSSKKQQKKCFIEVFETQNVEILSEKINQKGKKLGSY